MLVDIIFRGWLSLKRLFRLLLEIGSEIIFIRVEKGFGLEQLLESVYVRLIICSYSASICQWYKLKFLCLEDISSHYLTNYVGLRNNDQIAQIMQLHDPIDCAEINSSPCSMSSRSRNYGY